MSNLQSLQSKIEERLKREMVPAFLEKYERWHTRKGLRTNCDCDYCKIKKQATIDIGSGIRHIHSVRGRRFVDLDTFETMVESPDGTIETLGDAIEDVRESLRIKYRQKLQDSSEVI